MASVTQDIIEERGRLSIWHLYGPIVSRLGLARVLPAGPLLCEVTGSCRGHGRLLPYGWRGATGLAAEARLVSAEPAFPPRDARRGRVVSKIGFGVRAINTFFTCCRAEPLGPPISACSPGAPEGAEPRGERA